VEVQFCSVPDHKAGLHQAKLAAAVLWSQLLIREETVKEVFRLELKLNISHTHYLNRYIIKVNKCKLRKHLNVCIIHTHPVKDN